MQDIVDNMYKQMEDKYFPHHIHVPTGMRLMIEKKGEEIDCENCKRPACLRKQTLSKNIMKPLIYMVKNDRSLTPDQIDKLFGSKMWSVYKRVKYWGFLIPDGDGYRASEKAIEFVNGSIRTLDFLWIYNDVPRLVDKDMYGKWVSIDQIIPYEEMNAEIAASESIPLDPNVHKSI